MGGGSEVLPGRGGDAGTPDCIAAGDLVVVWEGPHAVRHARAAAGAVYDMRHGHFRCGDWVGKRFGSRVNGHNGRGWVYLLRPTPELWTLALKHRTQILYAADIALVCAQLELVPGSRVLESGTGSGSLTTSLARAVAPHGRVHTFEFHEQRADVARDEFAANGLAGLVEVTQRDIEADGFPAALEGLADAVFLDLPGPWKVVPSATRCLVPGGAFCAFSPCIEQVQRTADALREHGFVEVRPLEILLREYEVQEAELATTFDAVPRANGRDRGPKRRRTDDGEPADARGGAEAPAPASEKVVVAKPTMDAKGHTGYLLFARKGVHVDEEAEEEPEEGAGDS